MKKITIVVLIAALLGIGSFLLWRHARLAKDGDPQAKLTGTWTFGVYDMLRCTNVVTTDGRFNMSEANYLPNKTNVDHVTGTWIAKDGYLIETIVSSTERRRVQLPHTTIYPIVRLNDNELVFLYMKKSTNEIAWKRVIE